MSEKIRPIQSVILQFARELRGMDQEELGEKVGFEKSVIAALERGEEDPEPESLELLMAALGVSEWTFDELKAIGEVIRDVKVDDRWIGEVLVTGEQLRIVARESGHYANFMRRNFHQQLLDVYVLSETEERKGGKQAGNGTTPESVS